MPVKRAPRPFTRKAEPSLRMPGQSIACQLGGDPATITTTEYQSQYMRSRGLRSTIAVLAAALFFGELG